LGFAFSYLIFSNNSNYFCNPQKQKVLIDKISNSHSSKKEKLVIEKYNLSDESHKNITSNTLIDYPLYALRNAKKKKEEIKDKKYVESKYKLPKETSEIKLQKELVFKKFKSRIMEDRYWLGESSININDKVYLIKIIFQFYDADDFKLENINEIKNPDNLCWHFSFFIENLKDGWLGYSACAGYIRRLDGSFFLAFDVQSSMLQEIYSHIAIELPFDEKYTKLDLLSIKDRKWLKSEDLISWSEITKEMKNALEDDLRKSTGYEK